MNRLFFVPFVCVTMGSAASLAQESTPAPQASAAAVEASIADPLDEARRLVEEGKNTRENLKKAIALYEANLVDKSLSAKVRADGYADEARALLRLGDLEPTDALKLGRYAEGRVAAQKALAIDPKNASALFWDTANLATTGRTKGVMNSLFMIPDLRTALARVLALNPNHHYARQTLAEIDHSVPGIAGGSNERAEKGYLEILRRDPTFTPAMFKLAQCYRDTGDEEAARKYANQVLNAPRSSVPSDWNKFNKPDAKALLKEMGN